VGKPEGYPLSISRLVSSGHWGGIYVRRDKSYSITFIVFKKPTVVDNFDWCLEKTPPKFKLYGDPIQFRIECLAKCTYKNLRLSSKFTVLDSKRRFDLKTALWTFSRPLFCVCTSKYRAILFLSAASGWGSFVFALLLGGGGLGCHCSRLRSLRFATVRVFPTTIPYSLSGLQVIISIWIGSSEALNPFVFPNGRAEFRSSSVRFFSFGIPNVFERFRAYRPGL